MKGRRFRRGDIVEILRGLPHADQYTPRPYTIGRVAGTDYRRGNKHPVLVVSLDEPGHADWFPESHLAPAWWWVRDNSQGEKEA